MKHILIVASETIGTSALAKVIRARIAEGPCDFWLLVPSVAPRKSVGSDFGSAMALGGGLGLPEPNPGYQLARTRLRIGVRWMNGLGATVDGDIGDEDALTSATASLAVRPYDEVIVSTLPKKVSRWLHQDLPHQIRRRVNIPVTVVEAPAATSIE